VANVNEELRQLTDDELASKVREAKEELFKSEALPNDYRKSRRSQDT